MSVTFPGESPEYRAARDKLLQQEVELRRATEAVAKARRELPPGGLVAPGYVFEVSDELGSPKRVELKDLFGPKHDTLALYSFMYGPDRKEACPMCTGLLDGLNGVAEHLAQRLELCVVAESPLSRLLEFAKQRDWKRLRLISAVGKAYNTDYHGKSSKGTDTTMLNVFQRKNGEVRHFWASQLCHTEKDPGQDDRNLDIITPTFNVLDLTPEGRGDFYTKLRY